MEGKIPVIDLHSHMLINLHYLKKDLSRRVSSPLFWNPLKNMLDLPKISEGGYRVIVSDVYVPGIFGVFLDYFKDALAQLDTLSHFVEKNNERMVLAKSGKEVVEAVKKGDRIVAVPAIEGGHHIGNSVENLHLFRERGVFYITLTHFVKNRIVGSCSFKFLYRDDGLTSFGREVVREMEKIGIVPDLAHISSKGFFEVASIYNGPLFVSHTGVRAFNDSERNLSDEQIREIGRKDGLIGIIMFPWYLKRGGVFSIARIWAKTAAYISEKIGPEHVAIGTDFDGYIFSVREIRDASMIQKLRRFLEEEGFSREEIEGIFWKNALRFMERYYGG